MSVCVLSCFSPVWLFETLWTVALQSPLSMGFSRQEYWSGSPLPSPGDLPDTEFKRVFSATPVLKADSLPLSHQGSPNHNIVLVKLNCHNVWVSLVAQMVKNLPAMKETWIQSLGWEDPLEEGMATYSSILVWRIQWTEEPGGLQFMGLQSLGHDWAAKDSNTVLFKNPKRLRLKLFTFGICTRNIFRE